MFPGFGTKNVNSESLVKKLENDEAKTRVDL